MKIDNKLIKKLQRLSMLKITAEQEKETITALQDILNFTDNLNSLDLSHINEIAFSPLKAYTALREDEVSKNEQINSDILKNAPLVAKNCFVVPAIIG